MDTVTVSDLRTHSGEIWRRLRDHEDLLLTASGRPVAVMFGLQEDEDLEMTLRVLRQARAQAAVARMRAIAIEETPT